jgi:hypothetical protein
VGAGPLTEECVAAGLAAPELRSAAPVRFFRSRLLERLTRAHPACPYVLFAPVIGWALWAAATAMGPRWGALAALFAGGVAELDAAGVLAAPGDLSPVW